MRTRTLLTALLLGFALARLAVSDAPAAEPADAAKIKQLVEQLGADSYAERQSAFEALGKIGPPALGELRQAAKSSDAEVRKRAGELLVRIERLAESKQILDPKVVKLTFKETPLKKAVEEFTKQSGYGLVLVDPENKLKDVKVTLDTGKVAFWEAVAKLGDAAGVHDEDPNAFLGAPGRMRPGGAPAAGPAAPRPAAGAGIDGEVKVPAGAPARAGAVFFVRDIGMVGGGAAGPRPAGLTGSWVLPEPGQIYLMSGKPPKAPADLTTAVRVRPADRKRYPAAAGEKQIGLVLQLAAEPKVRWKGVLAAQIDKAIDDQGQKLSAAGEAEAAAALPAVRAGGGRAPMPPDAGVTSPWISGNGVYHFVPVRLRKGEKETKALKELAGTVSGQALTESEPLLVVEDVLKAKGKEVKGKHGGELKVTDVVKQPDGTTQIKFEFEPPEAVTPDTVLAQPATSVKRTGTTTPPAAMVIGRPGTWAPYGLRLVDEKDALVPSQIAANWARGPRLGAAARRMELHATFKPTKEAPAEPAKLVFMGRREVMVSVPFTLKDVQVK